MDAVLSWTDTLSALGLFILWNPVLKIDSLRNNSSTLSRSRLLRGCFWRGVVVAGPGPGCHRSGV